MTNFNDHSLLTGLPCKQKVLCKNEFLFTEGDPVQSFFLVHTGGVNLFRVTSSGLTVLMQSAGSGDYLAEASLFADYYHCSSAATANGTEVSYCSKTDFLEKLGESRDDMFGMLKQLAGQIMELRTLSQLKNVRSAKERVLSYLTWKAGSDGVAEIFPTGLDVANKIGLAHETFYRKMAELETEGFIERKEKKICIKK